MAFSGVNTYSGQGATGVYKDIRDYLFYIEGNEAPIQEMAGYTKAKDKRHYWEEVKYTTNSSNTEQRAEGADLTADTPPTQTERSNYTEINSETYYISTTTQAISKAGGKAGVKSQLLENKKQAAVELKGKLEASLLIGTAASGDNGATPAARAMDGLIPMASSIGSTAYNANVSGGESVFKALLATMRSVGGLRTKKKMVYTSYTNKDGIASNWTGIATDVNTMAKDARVYADVKVYVSQFGPIALKGHDVCPDTDLVVFAANEVKIAWLDKTQSKLLGDTGLSTKFSIFNECTLQYDKPSTLGHMLIS